MSLRALIEEFHTRVHADDETRQLADKISKHPPLEVVHEYRAYYNEKNPRTEWHFWWIFSGIPLEFQMALIENSVGLSVEARTVFDKRIVSENRILDLLQVPEDSEHKTALQTIGCGWEYRTRVGDPPQAKKDESLKQLLRTIRYLL